MMPEKDTLLAHLAHQIAGGTENAATEALVYILNKSKPALDEFNELIKTATNGLVEDCVHFETQVITDDNSRPDFVGFDKDREKRVIGEAKFWAKLQENQGSRYLNQLACGNAVLMFVVPDIRIDYLWSEVERDIVGNEDVEEKIEFFDTGNRRKVARVRNTDRYLLMVSWRDLLNKLYDSTTEEPGVQADIRQLQGLAEIMDSEEVRPFGQEELGPDVGRRMRDLRRLYDDVVGKWNDVEWADTSGYGSSAQPQTGYGRYLVFAGYEAWFGVYYDLWARGDCADTPFWLELYGLNQDSPAVVRSLNTRLNVNIVDDEYIPIYLKPGVIGEAIVDHIVGQLSRIADAIEEATQ